MNQIAEKKSDSLIITEIIWNMAGKGLVSPIMYYEKIANILNLNDIHASEFIKAYLDKDVYLNNLHKNPKSWDGKQPVAIVDIDDVLSEFRVHFADHLVKEWR